MYICTLIILYGMKRICLLFLAIVLGTAVAAQDKYAANIDSKVIQSAYYEYMFRFPQSELQDFYKFCFQDFFGPGHIISSAQAAEQYLMSELSSAASFGGPLYEACGIQGQYVRVNISLVADSVVPMSVFLNAFVSSAAAVTSDMLREWPACWAKIVSALPQTALGKEASADFLRMLDQVFEKGEYAFHHSRQFNAAYNFHYRIVKRELFEQMLLPLIVRHYGASANQK